MKPRMILAAMAGGAAGVLVFIVTGAGLVATPSPGSIFAYAAETPKGGWFGVFAGVIVAAGVSFAVGSLLLGFGRLADPDADGGPAEGDLAEPTTDPAGARRPGGRSKPSPSGGMTGHDQHQRKRHPQARHRL
jgi:PTS system mannitol-specific IIC component